MILKYYEVQCDKLQFTASVSACTDRGIYRFILEACNLMYVYYIFTVIKNTLLPDL